MSLSKRSVETLLDLVEIKLSCMEVWDRDDQREASQLQQCAQELSALAQALKGGIRPAALPAPEARRRGRRPRAIAPVI